LFLLLARIIPDAEAVSSRIGKNQNGLSKTGSDKTGHKEFNAIFNGRKVLLQHTPSMKYPLN
jgi:hypothetical protein